MNWVYANWIWILIGVAFVAMHMFGHGGHGGHGGRGESDPSGGRRPSDKREEDRPAGHQH